MQATGIRDEFQQLSAPVLTKGIETCFYRYNLFSR
jgi:maltooligosyltrehalose synthase